MKEIKLRPHHMLCLQLFEGKGYSDEFVENMSEIKRYLEENNPKVRIVEHADDICSHCPNCRDGICKEEQSVQEHDSRVYAMVINKVCDNVDWNTITGEINDRILKPNLIKNVCVKCQWSDICFNKNIEM